MIKFSGSDSDRATVRNAASCLKSDVLYTLDDFKLKSGLGDSTLKRARKAGIPLATLNVGRRKYVTGATAIDFVKTLAAHDRAQPNALTAGRHRDERIEELITAGVTADQYAAGGGSRDEFESVARSLRIAERKRTQ